MPRLWRNYFSTPRGKSSFLFVITYRSTDKHFETTSLLVTLFSAYVVTSGHHPQFHMNPVDGKTMDTVKDFIFLGSKITLYSNCRHEIKRCLLPGRKAMTNLDSILKSRDITLPTKVPIVKALVFPVVMHRYESWPIKKAEHQETDAFKM